MWCGRPAELLTAGGTVVARAAVGAVAPEQLELSVRGPVRSEVDMQTPLATAREWVALHAGRLESELRAGVSTTRVRLPLVTAHA